MDNAGQGGLAMNIGGGNLGTHRGWAVARGWLMYSGVHPAAGA
jgi:hypothetical protein